MTVVIDTNCFIVCIARKSKFRSVFDAFLNRRFTIAMCDDLLFEYEEVISSKASPEVSENIRDMLLSRPNVKWQEIFYKWLLIYTDSDDNKLADLAIASNADFLVTDDKHFNELKKIAFPKITIVSLEEFQKILIAG